MVIAHHGVSIHNPYTSHAALLSYAIVYSVLPCGSIFRKLATHRGGSC